SPTMPQNRFESSIASSFDFTSTIAQPTTASLASVKGPSVTVTWPPLLLITVVRGSRAPVATRLPLRKPSSTNAAIFLYSSGVGARPEPDSGSAVVFMKYFIGSLPGLQLPFRQFGIPGREALA